MTSTRPEQASDASIDDRAVLYGDNAAYIDWMLERYENDPTSVDPSWHRFLSANDERDHSLRDGPLNAAELPLAVHDAVRVQAMIRAFRSYGHLHADLDPLDLAKRRSWPELEPATYGFRDGELDRHMTIEDPVARGATSPRELLRILRAIYCATIGYEFAHIADATERLWWQERAECWNRDADCDVTRKRAILQQLIETKGYERYLDQRFTNAKRFGIDGAEATIPAVEAILAHGATLGLTDVVMGMAHRGRLNVLSQVFRKPHRAIFAEFAGGTFIPDGVEGSGDVKYHLGASADRDVGGHQIHLSLAANPSHLEISDPVVLGKARAKQDQNADHETRGTVLPLLIHGDAAFAGQGVVAECFGLSGLAGHTTGGSIHFIINNQVGFTTDPECSRSSIYASDLAKSVGAPILHVNGDDVEAVVHVAQLAIEYRQTFHRPVVIDMHCFRLYGHNEGDEPAFTQPIMYAKIRARASTLEVYAERLIAEGVVTRSDVDDAKARWNAYLEREFAAAKSYKPATADSLGGRWTGIHAVAADTNESSSTPTAVDLEMLKIIGAKLTEVPEGFAVHGTVQRFLDARRKMMATGQGIDWSTAEALALGSLVDEGCPVRLTGQDSERGTFTQRHAAIFDQKTGARFIPLSNIRIGQGRIEVINSMLSEEAVLAFEYGYSLAEPNALVLWEAQFGDFANGAQVVFDQFLSSGERKWLRMSGLVCLLPHGYDGQGPEHSSARLERYLQSSAEENWQVVNCTTPANYFHVLRRQLKRDLRKPLILMTPKSLLRNRRCRSNLAQLADGSAFQSLMPDDAGSIPAETITAVADGEIRRVVLCSGKVYYDLYEEREKRARNDVYLLRVEQLYPFPLAETVSALSRFKNADVVWCQEEPRNMGAWSYVEPYLETALDRASARSTRARYVGRPASASTATGQLSQHLAQQSALIAEALSDV